ncbi:SIS domain-containing protein [Luteipulveratus sp. YIM 133132]|uniref:SIS domain-containing protein n=1 Tax=Luteipulveratus flavus TaxID=3031728 RepID=A0ABT6C559_9MICO|nr:MULTISPECIES: SIS domain-containing protein [unclassified Luteipulveratus]MDE9364542.1 SIS domain-containing protein [Luteipulveratus sp. YIM 133132]MDF8264079.1 SIS domain-containing protein [Luteipulveratus sp. YIM 133296]
MEGSGLMAAAHPLRATGPEALQAAVRGQHAAGVASWAALAQRLAEPGLVAEVDAAGAALVQAMVDGGTLLVAGNGGSAAIASHVAAEFIGKCIHDRDPLPAVSLAESLSSITAVGNDYGYEHVFTRGLAALGRPGDVLLAMSTSGSSPNVLAALDAARERGILTVALTGARGAGLRGRADHVLVVPSQETPRIQEVHMLWAHAWCEAVDVLCR